MWSQHKPPVTNWLLLKFIKYEKLNLNFFSSSLTLLSSKANESKNHLVLSKGKKFSFFVLNVLKNFKINYSFLNLSLTFFSLKLTLKKDYNIKNFIELIETSLSSFNIIKFTKSRFKNFLFLKKENKFLKPLFMKDFFFFKYNFILKKKSKDILPNENLFLYNCYYSLTLLKIFSEKFFLSTSSKKLLLYNYDKIAINLVQNKFERVFKTYNNYLLIQKGFFKKSLFFLNKHYLLSTSSQNYNLYKYNLLKLYFFDDNIFKYLKKKDINKKKNMEGIYIWNWNLVILPLYINKIFYIYTGRRFTWIWIVPAMVNRKFGEFSFTRKVHTRKLKINFIFKNIE